MIKTISIISIIIVIIFIIIGIFFRTRVILKENLSGEYFREEVIRKKDGEVVRLKIKILIDTKEGVFFGSLSLHNNNDDDQNATKLDNILIWGSVSHGFRYIFSNVVSFSYNNVSYLSSSIQEEIMNSYSSPLLRDLILMKSENNAIEKNWEYKIMGGYLCYVEEDYLRCLSKVD